VPVRSLSYLPGLRIWAPTGQDRYETSQPSIELAGVMSLAQPIRKLEWETSRGGGSNAGPQGDFAGLDQVNVRLARGLAGRGEVQVLLSVEGKPANTVTVNIR
jgi:hypothetical protein